MQKWQRRQGRGSGASHQRAGKIFLSPVIENAKVNLEAHTSAKGICEFGEAEPGTETLMLFLKIFCEM